MMAEQEQRCLLAVFAHPDDEAFGVGGSLRTYADQGVRTALICATRGEEGEISDPALATKENLGQVREAELRESCRILGVSDLGFLDYRDAALNRADPAEAVGRIVRHIRRLRPQVMTTFDPSGVYGHPDHIAIHHLTLEAFRRAGDPAAYPEQLRHGDEGGHGPTPYAPQKLYVGANPVSAMGTVRQEMEALGVAYRPGGNAATIPVERMGTPDEDVTTVIALDDRAFEAKLAALHAHRTQMNPDSFVNRLSPAALRRWRGSEYFVLIYPQGAPGGGQEHDLFAGVRV